MGDFLDIMVSKKKASCRNIDYILFKFTKQ